MASAPLASAPGRVVASFDVEGGRETSELHAGTSYGRDADERVPLQSRAVSWIIVPPQWAELTLGCDFCTLQNAPRFLLLILLVSILIFASETLTPGKVEALLEWLHEDPTRGSVAFLALLIGGHLIAFPSIVLSLAGGAVFGVFLGSILVWLGVSIGQILTFWVGRYLLRDWVCQIMLHYFPKWPAIDAAISKEGWKLVALLRLSPVIPWNVLNYSLACSGISFTAYALPSTISIIPWCGTTVYFGSLARDLAGIVDGRIPFQSGSASYIFYGVSGLMMVVGVTYMTIFSRRAIRRALASSNTGSNRIAEELDALELLATSPRAPGSPSSAQAQGQWPWQLPTSPTAGQAPALRSEAVRREPHGAALPGVPASPFHATLAA